MATEKEEAGKKIAVFSWFRFNGYSKGEMSVKIKFSRFTNRSQIINGNCNTSCLKLIFSKPHITLFVEMMGSGPPWRHGSHAYSKGGHRRGIQRLRSRDHDPSFFGSSNW